MNPSVLWLQLRTHIMCVVARFVCSVKVGLVYKLFFTQKKSTNFIVAHNNVPIDSIRDLLYSINDNHVIVKKKYIFLLGIGYVLHDL